MSFTFLHHLLNVFVQLANKRGLKKKFIILSFVFNFLYLSFNFEISMSNVG
jgi:hypothetical protein